MNKNHDDYEKSWNEDGDEPAPLETAVSAALKKRQKPDETESEAEFTNGFDEADMTPKERFALAAERAKVKSAKETDK